MNRFDLLAQVLGGDVRVPRQVLDPQEDPNGIESMVSEIGRSDRYCAKRSIDPDSMDNWSRLRSLRSRADIVVVDLEGSELAAFAQLTGPAYAKTANIVAPLGAGEAAVIAISECRGWTAILDDAAARTVLRHRSPDVGIVTTRDLIRKAVAQELVDDETSELIYCDMRAKGYRGPPELWD